MNFADLERSLKLKTQKTSLVVCMPHDLEAILAAKEVDELGYATNLFVGDPAIVKPLLDQHTPGFSPEIIPAFNEEEAAAKSVQLIRQKKGQVLMKGVIATPIFLKAILNSETGIKKGKLLSHVLVYEWKGSLKFLTDSGMIPEPTLAEKEEIIRNVIPLAHKSGFSHPRVAVLAAVETVNLNMRSTIDAAVLAKMGDRKQFGNCQIDGPLAFDNAICEESAHHKGLYNDVVGKADILVCPDIDTGNILGKIIIYCTETPAGGLVIGATAPVIMLSRSDTKKIRLNSIKLALSVVSYID